MNKLNLISLFFLIFQLRNVLILNEFYYIKSENMGKIFVGLLVALLVVSVFASTVLAKPKEPLDSITFIHYKDGKIKPIDQNGKTVPCYKLMGVKWKSFSISYVIGTNVDSTAISTSTKEWDDHTSTALFGSYRTDSSANFDSSPDGRNEYSYGNYPTSGVIAVTRTWYTRRSKEIVEYDVMFDSDFSWGDASKNTSVMDWQSIATHETGHGLGLADVYQSACSAVTMYGYGSEGETFARSLEQPDITGLQQLYGA